LFLSQASRTDGGEGDYEKYYFELRNQGGKVVDLPPEERKNIVMAMTLHVKAKYRSQFQEFSSVGFITVSRKLMKANQYKQALPLLLKADSCFAQWYFICTARTHKAKKKIAKYLL
jgi:hypothetical protein